MQISVEDRQARRRTLLPLLLWLRVWLRLLVGRVLLPILVHVPPIAVCLRSSLLNSGW